MILLPLHLVVNWPVFTILLLYDTQSCCDPSTSLGRCIIGLLETDPRIDTGTLPMLERLRGCLRLLFHSSAL